MVKMKVKIRKILRNKERRSEIGEGVESRGVTYVTHSSLERERSAVTTCTKGQLFMLGMLLVLLTGAFFLDL